MCLEFGKLKCFSSCQLNVQYIQKVGFNLVCGGLLVTCYSSTPPAFCLDALDLEHIVCIIAVYKCFMVSLIM